MENSKIRKSIAIHASKEKVWNVLLTDETYNEWTKPFAEGSTADHEPGWPEGSKVLFKDGEGQGMVSRVKEHKTNETITFEHLGMLDKDGKEDLDSDEVKKWQGSTERYDVTESDGVTTLSIYMDGWGSSDEELAKFNTMWDDALATVKKLAEK